VKILVTGCCGFTGFRVLNRLRAAFAGAVPSVEWTGVDSLIRPGSEINRRTLAESGVRVIHADVRSTSDMDSLPPADWVIDAAASPSVLAGTDGQTSSRQIVEHNLLGTVNLLEYCRRCSSGLILISTSRVYSIEALRELPLEVSGSAFRVVESAAGAALLAASNAGVTERFSTAAPVSLYGATKLASEALALEYQSAFGIPVWINRCGLLAGEGQFGRPDQGIVAWWIHSWQQRRPLKYLGFGGVGHQVRDCLHPDDLADLLLLQMTQSATDRPRLLNVSGGASHAFSLRELSAWCAARFGSHDVQSVDSDRAFDVPWLVLDSSRARAAWDWHPQIARDDLFERIARFAEQNPEWLDLSASGCGSK